MKVAWHAVCFSQGAEAIFMTSMQTTIQREVSAVGVGLHSGKPIHLTLKPAAPNTGVVYCRTDLGGTSVKTCVENLDFNALQLATTLRKDDAVIQTIEHLQSALFSYGVDNIIVEIDGAEVPIMDGSSAPFLVLLEEAGLKQQRVAAKMLKVTKPFEFEADGKRVWVQPASDFRISYEIVFDHPLIRNQQKTVVVGSSHYENQIAPARTFGFLRDVNYLKSKGLVRGGSIDNAIVLDGDRMLNESLRLDDEFVSHKILDFIGDLSVSGMRLQGHFHGYKAGHEMHAKFLQALLAAQECYEIVELEPEATSSGPSGDVLARSVAGAA